MTPAAYRTFNWTILGLVAYGALLPVLLPLMRMHWGDFPASCLSVMLFDTPCPLCGLTRGLTALAHGNLRAATAFHILAIPCALLMATEFAARIAILAVVRQRTPPPAFIRADLRLHVGLLAAYAVYCVLFYAGVM